MRTRPEGFLSEENYDKDEMFDYIRELHGYLWRFVNIIFPFAGGSIRDYLDVAIEKFEYDNKGVNNE